MKQFLKVAGAVVLAVFIFQACSKKENEKERDVQKLADIACEMRVIALSLNESDFEGLTRFTQKMAEFSELSNEISTKYNITDEEDEEFEQLLRNSLLNTPCRDVDLDDLFDFF
jgi:site-specific DNA-adenine methylase